MWKLLFSSIIFITIIGSTKSMIAECQWMNEQCYQILKTSAITQPYEVVTIAGKPVNYINTVTTSLKFLDCVLKYFPSGIFTVFPNLSSLSISNSQSTAFSANLTSKCAYLESLFISGGIILNIPEGFIQKCTQLTVLVLGSNRIETIDKKAFKGLTSMTSLDMSFNNITCIPGELFQNLPNIRSINLSYNKLKAINSEIFKNVPSLMYISFALNLLQYLPTFDFNGTSTQTQSYISFQNNPINALSPDFLSVFEKRGSLPDFTFDLAEIPCLNYYMYNGYFVVDKTNYKESAQYLKKCFQNWTTSMTGNVVCGQSIPPCPIASVWQKLLDYLKSIKLF